MMSLVQRLYAGQCAVIQCFWLYFALVAKEQVDTDEAHDVTGAEAVRWSVCRNTMLLAVFCIGGKGAS